MTHEPWPIRFFRWLQDRLLSDAFEEEHGEAQRHAFHDLHAEAARKGRLAVLMLLTREAVDMIRAARGLRREEATRMENGVDGEGARRVWMADAGKDVSVALRLIGRSRTYSLLVMLILATGIAATTSVFTVVNGALFRPLPYEDADRLTLIWSELDASTDPTTMTVSPPDFMDWRERARSFSGIGAHNLWFPVLSGGEGDAQSVMAGLVTPDLFEVLGVRPHIGRTFRPEEGDGADVVILSHALWQSRYGGDAQVLGQSVLLNGRSHEVIGVLPADYRHPDPHRPLLETELFAPFNMESWATSGGRFLRVVGRLASGVSVAQAEAEMDALSTRLEEVRPEANRDVRAQVLSLRDQFYQSSRTGLLFTLVGAALVFLIVVANVANLVLTRNVGRRREFAIRASLGAGRRRIARQILIENGILALGGSVIGLVALFASVDLLRGVQGRLLPVIGDIQIDVSVVVFAVVLAVATTLFLGLLPLGEFFATPVRGVLSEEGGGSGGSRRSQGIRRALVVGEIAIAAALVFGAGLLGRSYQKLSGVGPGFESERLLTLELTAPSDRYPDPDSYLTLYRDLRERLSALPGVESVAHASELPLIDGNWSREVQLGDRPADPSAPIVTEIRFVSDGYFRTMGIPVLEGREFESSDRADTSPVVVVNRAFASRYWEDGSAIGTLVRWEGSEDEIMEATIVGVVGDVLDDGLNAAPEPFVYYPFEQSPRRSSDFVLRGSGDPGVLMQPIRNVIRSTDSALPLDALEAYADRIQGTLAAPEFASALALAFSVLALCVAGLGIYGVMSYTVRARTREIGIRTALGARGGDVASMVVRQSLALTLLGVALGVGLSLILGRLISSLLFGVSGTDPASLVLVPAVLVAVAVLASYLPARKALSVQPVEALRADGR